MSYIWQWDDDGAKVTPSEKPTKEECEAWVVKWLSWPGNLIEHAKKILELGKAVLVEEDITT